MLANALLTAGTDEEFFLIIIATIVGVVLFAGAIDLYDNIRRWERNRNSH